MFSGAAGELLNATRLRRGWVERQEGFAYAQILWIQQLGLRPLGYDQV